MAPTTMTAVGFEPELDEIIKDPIVKSLMARDGVNTEDLLAVLDQARPRSAIERAKPRSSVSVVRG